MQRCPKCGYRDRVDWPGILWVLAFGFLYLVFVLTAERAPRSYRFMGFVAFLLFTAGTGWRALRGQKDRSEYLKLNPPVRERVKNQAEPSQ